MKTTFRENGTKADLAAPETGKLSGRLSATGVTLTVLGYVAPLAAAAGYVPLVIGYGNGIGAPLSFAVVGFMLLIFAVGYTAMVRAVPRPGGFYTYITAGLGKVIGVGSGFLAAALYILAGVGFAIFGGLAAQSFFLNAVGIDIPWWIYVVGYLSIAGFCAYRGADFNGRVLGVIVMIEVIVLTAFIVFSVVSGGPEGRSAEPFTLGGFTSGSISIGILFASTLYGGFESTALYREEVRDPDRSIPRATYTLVIIMTVLYGATAYALITAIGIDNIAATAAEDPASVMTMAIDQQVGHMASLVVSALLLLSALASQLATVNATSRYFFSFAADRLLPHNLAIAHPRLGSPHRAAMLTVTIFALVVLAVVVTGTDPVLAYGTFGGVGIFAFQTLLLLVSLSCIVYFIRNGRGGRSIWTVAIAPTISVIAIAVLLWYSATQATLLLGVPTVLTPIGFGFVGLSFIVGCLYALWLRTRRPRVYAGVGRQAS
ncbi:APC family permease [Corynebacterium pacaense]|uniref:APC family permease n=1 Tax=Corynebacterium pacaense TaxID=1816684 RepID=UPI0009BC67FA|nr:APC family permease [Corynebacterium pacaense]